MENEWLSSASFSDFVHTLFFFTIHIIIAFFRIFLSYLYVGMCTRVDVPLEGVKCPRARGPKWLWDTWHGYMDGTWVLCNSSSYLQSPSHPFSLMQNYSYMYDYIYGYIWVVYLYKRIILTVSKVDNKKNNDYVLLGCIYFGLCA